MGEHKFKRSSTRQKPNRTSRSVITLLIVLVVVGTVIGLDLWQNNNASPLTNFIPERSKGAEDAPIRIVEFLDFQCSHCKEGSEVLKEWMMLHPEKIRLTLKYYPLGQINSSMSAYYVECAAAQDKFWAMHDKLFEAQDEWRTLLKVKPVLNSLASDAGLDVEKLEACTDSNRTKKAVAQDRAVGDTYSVRSTPTYFVNGEMTVGIFSLKKRLEDLIEKE